MTRGLDPGMPPFVGLMLGGICLFVAALTYVSIPSSASGSDVLVGLSVGIAAVGVGFAALGVLIGGLLRLRA